MTEPAKTVSGNGGGEEIGDPILAEVLRLAREVALELRPRARGGLRVTPDGRIDRDLGIDSLGRVELVARLERRFGVRLSVRVMTETENLRDLAAAVRAAREAAAEEEQPAVMPPPLEETAVPEHAESLSEVLRWHAERRGDRVHIRLLADEGGIETVTYGALYEEARRVAAGLRRRGLGAGDRAAVMMPTCRQFFTAFAGILLAGCVPVPVYPPFRLGELREHLLRQRRILANAGARLLFVTRELERAAVLVRALVPEIEAVVHVEDFTAAEAGWSAPDPAPDALALLQYTSGSTGDPKGVMLTHANLLANIRAMGQAMEAGPADIFASWLPLYHDMGLIGAWLGTLYYTAPLVLMSPQRFLTHPADWLWAIHRARATLTAAPNFAFELCLRRIADAELEGLDLSCLRMAANGAEPVRASTIRRFVARFAPYGFRETAMAPVYGLAENSVGLAFPPPGRSPVIDRVDAGLLARRGEAVPVAEGHPKALEIVGCGFPIPGHEIRIVDGSGRELAERRQGRIQFRGPSACRGYFANPEATARLFDGDWLETGDLGYTAGGELFVTGRQKDLVIRAGRNIHPQDVEELVGDIEGVRRGCVAVIGVPEGEEGTERLVVLADPRLGEAEGRAALEARIRERVTALLGEAPDEVLLLPPRALPKTSSGKLRRSAAAELYRSGRLGRARAAPWRQIAALLLAAGRERLRVAHRRAVAIAYGIWFWTVLLLMALPAWLGVVLVPGAGGRFAIARGAARLFLRLVGIPLTVEGGERLPRGGAVLAANHASYLDGLVLTAALPRRLAFVAKGELARNPVAGPFLARLGAVFVRRGRTQALEGELAPIREALGEDRLLVVFPEGTFDRAPGLLPFHLGGFRVAAELGVPVLPVTIRGTRSILRAWQWLPQRGAVEITILEAVPPAGRDFGQVLALRDAVRRAMLGVLEEPDLETAVVLPPGAEA